jgi:hypothetical protein
MVSIHNIFYTGNEYTQAALIKTTLPQFHRQLYTAKYLCFFSLQKRHLNKPINCNVVSWVASLPVKIFEVNFSGIFTEFSIFLFLLSMSRECKKMGIKPTLICEKFCSGLIIHFFLNSIIVSISNVADRDHFEPDPDQTYEKNGSGSCSM